MTQRATRQEMTVHCTSQLPVDYKRQASVGQDIHNLFDIRIYTKMAASQQQKTDAEMTLSKLQNEVCAGRYVFKHPLVITACGVQDKYVVYTACLKCPKRVSEKGNGSV